MIFSVKSNGQELWKLLTYLIFVVEGILVLNSEECYGKLFVEVFMVEHT